MDESEETSLSLWTPVLINSKPPQLCFEALINRKRVENQANEFYRTEPIDVRLGENLIRLKNGENCRLIGDLYDPKACVPYDVKIKFRRGIPQNWSDIVQGWAKMLDSDHLEMLALSNYSQKKRLWTILKSLGFLKVSAKGRIIFPNWKFCSGDEVKINNILCNPTSSKICIPKLIHKLEKELFLKIGSKDSTSKDSSIKTNNYDSNLLSDTDKRLQIIPDNSRVGVMQFTSERNLRTRSRMNQTELVKNPNSRQNSSVKPSMPKNSRWVDNTQYSFKSVSSRKQEKQYSNVNEREQSICSGKLDTCAMKTRNQKRKELENLDTGWKGQNKVHKSQAKQIKNIKVSNTTNKHYLAKSTAADTEESNCKIGSITSEQLHRSTKNDMEFTRPSDTAVSRRRDEIKQNTPENLKFCEKKVNRWLQFSKPLTKENNEKCPSSVKKVTDFTSRNTSKYKPYELRKKTVCYTKKTSLGLRSKLYCDMKIEKKVESKKQIQSKACLSEDKMKAEKRTSVQRKKPKVNGIRSLKNREGTPQKDKNSNSTSVKRKTKECMSDGVPSVLSPKSVKSKSYVQCSDSKKKTLNMTEKEFVDLRTGLMGPPKTLSDRKKLKQNINRLSSSLMQPMDLFSDPNYHHLIQDTENASNQEWDADYLIALEQIRNGSQGDQISVGSATPPQKYILDSIPNEPQIIRATSPFDNTSRNTEEVLRYIHRQMKQMNKLPKEKNPRTKLCSMQLPSLDDQNAQELYEMAYNAMLSDKQMPSKLFDLKYRRQSDSDSSESSEY